MVKKLIAYVIVKQLTLIHEMIKVDMIDSKSKHTLFQGATSHRFISSALVGEALALKAASMTAFLFRLEKPHNVF